MILATVVSQGRDARGLVAMRKPASLVGILLFVVTPHGAAAGVVNDIATQAVQPVVDALGSAVTALWRSSVEQDQLKLETIKTQLEAAKWPDFDDIASQ